MHDIQWQPVIEKSATFLNRGKQDILRSLAGAHSINPMVLLTFVMVEKELELASPHQSDQDFFNGLKRLSTAVVRSHNQFERSMPKPKLNSAMSSVWIVLNKKDETLAQFVDIYHTLLAQNKIATSMSRKDRSLNERPCEFEEYGMDMAVEEL